MKGPDRVRRRPAVFFESDGILGATNALKMLLQIFIGEAADGVCRRISVTVCKDDTICIKSYDRGFLLDEEQINGKPIWYYDFCELYDPSDDPSARIGTHSHRLYGDASAYTQIDCDPSFDLTCVQYVSEFMHIRVARDGIVKKLAFAKGYCTEEPTVTRSEESTYTQIRFKPDAEVFGTSTVSTDTVFRYLQTAAIMVERLLCDCTDEKTGEIHTFCYPNGIISYADINVSGQTGTPLYVKKKSAIGKDRYDRHEYRADVKIALCFCKDTASITCIHNHRELCGGTHLQEVKEKILQYLSWVFADHEPDMESLTKHLILVLETKCEAHATRWENARRTAIANRMLTDMSGDLIDETFRQYLKMHRSVIMEIFGMEEMST